VNANNSNNNLGSVASSVSFGHQSEGNVNNGNWENENEENWNENNGNYTEYGNENFVNDGSTFFWFGAESEALRGTAAKENFNKVAAEVIAAHPEWRLESVAGNPQAFGEHQAGYWIGVGTLPATDPPALFAVWPQFVAAMEERIPAVGLPADLKASVGWRDPAEMPGAAFAAQMAQGGRRYNRKAKARKTRKARKSRRKTRRGRRN
jgi:hypothetical protein